MNGRADRVALAATVVFATGAAIWLLLRMVPGARRPVHLALVVAFGLLACWLAFERAEFDDRPVRPGEVETGATAPPPGGEIDRLLRRREEPRDWETSHVTRRLRDRLVPVAVDVLVHYAGLTPVAARERIADGSWTDDSVAAAFLTGREPPISRSLRRWIEPSAPTPLERVVRRSVDAVLRYTDLRTADRGRSTLDRIVRRTPIGEGEREQPGSGGRNGADPTDDRRYIAHWQGIGAFALAALAAGIALDLPGVLLGGAIGVGFAGYASLGRTPTVELAIERELDDSRPAPGDEVEVTVTVRNEGARTLPDVRLVDGVPPAIGVEDGSPRHATALRPGERTRFSYTVTARRGEHRFEPVTVVARDLPERVEVVTEVDSEASFVSKPRLRSTLPMPLRNRRSQFVGSVPTETGGDGLEFHGIREYRRGDPLHRIDWSRRARTGEFATVTLREERATNVVVALDCREAAYRAPAGAEGHACDRGVAAAAGLIAHLIDTGNRVGLATLHPEPCWLPVRTGRAHRARIREALAVHPSVGQAPPDGACYTVDWLDEFRARYEAPAQVVLVSPLSDDTATYAARALETSGYPVTLVSVDATSADSPGQRFARLERLRRLYRLRTAGVRTVDWRWEEPIGVALARAGERWRS